MAGNWKFGKPQVEMKFKISMRALLGVLTPNSPQINPAKNP